MSFRSIVHLLLHAIVPFGIALAFFRARWGRAWLIMMITMIVDMDHLLAQPLYDPNRCSIGFHPLHTWPAMIVYSVLIVPKRTRLVGLGLTVHMILDAIDCAWMRWPLF